MKFLPLFITIFILNPLMPGSAKSAEGRRDMMGEEMHAHSDRVRIINHAQLLGMLAVWQENSDYGGAIIPSLGEAPLKPSEIYQSMIRQITYERGAIADDVFAIYNKIRLEAGKKYGKAYSTAKKLIEDGGKEAAEAYFFEKASKLQELVSKTVLLNPPSERGVEANLLVRARVVLEPLIQDHERLFKVAQCVSKEGLEAIKDDPDLGRFYGLTEFRKGNIEMSMPAIAWACRHIAGVYKDMFIGLHHVMAGKRSASDFLSANEGSSNVRVQNAIPNLSVKETAHENFMNIFRQVVYIDNEALMAETFKTPETISLSDRQVSAYEWYRWPCGKDFRLPEVVKGTKKKKIGKPKKKARKKAKEKTAKVGKYAEHFIIEWFQELEEQFLEEVRKLLAAANAIHEDAAAGVSGSRRSPRKDWAAIEALRAQVRAEEDALAAEVFELEKATRLKEEAEERLRTKQQRVKERQRRKAEEEARRAAEYEARAEREARKASDKAAALKEKEARYLAAKIQREKEEAEEEARELEELKRRQKDALANREAAARRAKERALKTEEYRRHLAEEHAKEDHEDEDPRAVASVPAPTGSTLTESLDSGDLDVFANIFTGKPVKYFDVISLLDSLNAIEVERRSSTKPKIQFTLPDGSTKFLMLHKPHHEGYSLHRDSQNTLRWRLEEVGYTKAHFGIE